MLKLRIVTPEGITYEDDNLKSVTLPTTSGVITIMEDHEPLVSVIDIGEIVIDKGDYNVELAVAGGIVEVRDGQNIVLLAENAERAEDIDLERAEEAKKRAEEYLQKLENSADVEFAEVEAKIRKELARVQVGMRKKRGTTRVN